MRRHDTAWDTKKWCTSSVVSCYIRVNIFNEEYDMELANKKRRTVSLCWGTPKVSRIYQCAAWA